MRRLDLDGILHGLLLFWHVVLSAICCCWTSQESVQEVLVVVDVQVFAFVAPVGVGRLAVEYPIDGLLRFRDTFGIMSFWGTARRDVFGGAEKLGGFSRSGIDLAPEFLILESVLLVTSNICELRSPRQDVMLNLNSGKSSSVLHGES